ncbi:MAG: hypothetical protein Kow00124_15010 [Anaerolineae bacterium]
MRTENLSALERITLDDLERVLDRHTRQRIPVDQWTEFSWSVSRHTMFRQCRRRYYLNYYGARRVREANSAIISAIWWLKQIVDLPTWIGSVVHHVAASAIDDIRSRRRVDQADHIRRGLEYYRGGIDASWRGAKHEGQWIVLFEHTYSTPTLAEDVRAGERQVEALIKALFSSDAYRRIVDVVSQSPDVALEVDEPFQFFEFDASPVAGLVRVFAIPDVLLYENDTALIIDWKTGGVGYESIRDQAGVYRLYAKYHYDLPEDAITVQIADLASGGVSVDPPGGTPTVAEADGFIRASIAAMVEQMDDLEYNTVSIGSFPMTEDRSLCRRCGFRRACWRHTDDD